MYEFLEQDAAVVELYRDFLPSRVFDMHMHLLHEDTNPESSFARKTVGFDDYLTDLAPFYPNVREFRLNGVPMPERKMLKGTDGEALRAGLNDFIAEQVRTHPEHIGQIYVLSGDSAAEIARMADATGLQGIKCYWFTAGKQDGEGCEIADYLPEGAWEVAQAKHLPITLHMMHPHALSHEENYKYITSMAKKYPGANLILAHCARAFAPWTGVDSIRRLEDYGNIWFDLAAVCEAPSMMACIMTGAGKRAMWGTDYPICMHRGRVAAIGAGFSWLPEEGCVSHLGAPTRVIGEGLLALKLSASLLNLDATQIERIFYGNAMELMGLK